MNKSPKPDISVKSEVEFDDKREPEHPIIMENQIIPDNGTESEQKTNVHVKSEPEAVVWIKSEPETDTIEVKMELETDLKTEFDVGTKCDSFMVRLFKIAMQFNFFFLWRKTSWNFCFLMRYK